MTKDNNKKWHILGKPPGDFSWIDDIDGIDRLSMIYAKLEAIGAYFGSYSHANPDKPIAANEIYGYWFILQDICRDLAGILKLDYLTGEVGREDSE